MNHGSAFRHGYLLNGDERLPVKVREASRYSLLVASDAPPPDGAEFRGFVLGGGDQPVELGPCVFLLSESESEGEGRGRLVFPRELYDFHKLLGRGELHTLETYFNGLPLILNQKKSIRPEFREYVAELTFDLNVYKSYFDELDASLADEPESVRSVAVNSVLETKGREFLGFLDETLRKLEELIKDYTREEHALHGYYLRKQVWSLIEQSEFLLRTNVKPRGYAGDSDIMRMIYANDYRGYGIFARLMHKHGIETPAAQAVRNRRIMVPRILRETRNEFKPAGGTPFRIMSVACGPAWEMQDLFAGDEDFENLSLTLLDQDTDALDEAAAAIRDIEARRKAKVNVQYLNESVRTMLRIKNISEKWGRYHFIYSMGLFDYLAAPVARALVKKLYDMLLPGGHVLIGNYHVDNPTRWYMEYWMDWVLLYRTEQDFLDLTREIENVQARVFFEDTRAQMFLHVTKPRETDPN